MYKLFLVNKKFIFLQHPFIARKSGAPSNRCAAFCSLLCLISFCDRAGGCFPLIFIEDDLADAVGCDAAAGGILHTCDLALYGRLYGGVFEREVTVHHFAVLEHEVLCVAERLCADDLASDQRQILAVPCEVLALNDAVIDRNVLSVPERVLRVEHRVADHDILAVLERVFALHAEVFDHHAARVEERVLGFKRGILNMYAAAVPAELRRLDGAALECAVVAFSERLDAAELAVFDRDVRVIPKRGTAGVRHAAIVQNRVFGVPERVAQVEIAVGDDNIAALLQRGLAVRRAVKQAFYDLGIVHRIQCALLVQNQIFVLVQIHTSFPVESLDTQLALKLFYFSNSVFAF